MTSKGLILAAALAFSLVFVACSESVVSPNDEATTTLVKKVKPPPADDPADDPADFRSVTVEFADGAGDRIRSDARGVYADGECGVWANIGNWADARLDPDRDYKPKLARKCGDPRALVFEFPDWRGTKTVGAFMNINKIDNLAPGQFFTDSAQFNVCNTLVFEEVKTTRNSDGTWTTTTNGASDVAVCADGSVYAMPFTLTITE